MDDDEIRQTYNRALGATAEPYPEAYKIALRAIAERAWAEGHTAGYCEAKEDGDFFDLEVKTRNPYREGSK